MIDELQRMQVFYVNIGGGEPTVRPDFWELLDYAVAHQVGVKFSTNGVRITPERAAKLAATDYVDVQISLDGATAEVNDAVRGAGLVRHGDAGDGEPGRGRLRGLQDLGGAAPGRTSASSTSSRRSPTSFGAQLRLTRLRPSGRGADVWDELHPLPDQQRELYDWLVAHGEQVLTGDSFFHLSAYGQALPGLNLCGAGRVVCLIDPVGDVYACPFAIHEKFLAGNVRVAGRVRRGCGGTPSCSPSCASRRPAARARRARPTTPAGAAAWRRSSSPGCRSTGPDPECVQGTASGRWRPGRPTRGSRVRSDHSRSAPRERAATAGRGRCR